MNLVECNGDFFNPLQVARVSPPLLNDDGVGFIIYTAGGTIYVGRDYRSISPEEAKNQINKLHYQFIGELNAALSKHT